jgi:hypothetical protein
VLGVANPFDDIVTEPVPTTPFPHWNELSEELGQSQSSLTQAGRRPKPLGRVQHVRLECSDDWRVGTIGHLHVPDVILFEISTRSYL